VQRRPAKILELLRRAGAMEFYALQTMIATLKIATKDSALARVIATPVHSAYIDAKVLLAAKIQIARLISVSKVHAPC